MPHLSNVYSYRVIPPAFADGRRAVSALEDRDGNVSTEQRIQAAVSLGHRHYLADRYAPALEAYRQAFAMIHAYLYPDFPVRVGTKVLDKLRNLDLIDHVLAAGVEVARLRHVVGPRTPIVSSLSPPGELRELAETLRPAETVDPPSTARWYADAAVHYVHNNALAQARQLLARAEEQDDRTDLSLRADLQMAAAAVELAGGEAPERALSLMERAREQYAQIGDSEALAAVDNNMGVLHTLAGDGESAAAAFGAAGDRVPAALGRSLTQPLDRSAVSALQRPMGSDGLQLLLATRSEHAWITAKPSVTARAARRWGVLVDDDVLLDIDLDDDPVTDLREQVYARRVDATALGQLRVLHDPDVSFGARLGHLYGFTLPMSIADCHLQLDEFPAALEWYDKARRYAFLNRTIETPVLWLKIANAVLALGHDRYAAGDILGAQAEYRKIVQLEHPEVDPASPLYTPPFGSMRTAVEAILTAPEPIDPDTHDPAVATVVLLARMNLANIAAGIDLPLLSLQREQTPVFTFEYLQSVARYFAEHAISAERTYINFQSTAEQEQFTRSMLENAIALEQSNELLEKKKVQVAAEQRDAMRANLRHAQTQLTNAHRLRDDFANVSLAELTLDAELTYVGAPTTEYEFSGYEEYGISNGTHRVDEVLRTLTRRRREITREFELRNIDRRISELEASRAVAQAQLGIADAQVAAARAQAQVATLRRQQAQQQLALFDSQEFTPDLWHRLAVAMRAISKDYLTQAITVARLMEEVFEFETGEPADVIRASYVRNDLSGLLAGDHLLKDIDTFTFLRVMLSSKQQPMKQVVSLADRFPLQFLRDFQRTGRMSFRTELTDFDRAYPGSYSQRITRVEVVVEGLIGRDGVHGTLTNTGLCVTRRRDGRTQARLLKPETLLLSDYRVGQDSIVFRPDSEMLAVFEHSPLATSWVLEIRQSANDLVYHYLTDVKLVVYYQTFFDASLTMPVLEELAETQPLTGRRSIALRYERFDEFFSFQDTGAVTFAVGPTTLPFHHTDPRLEELTVLLEAEDGASAAGLTVRVGAGATAVAQSTGADGTISTGPGAAINALLGEPLIGDWTIEVREADNSAAFAAGFSWSQVRNIVVVAEYAFTPRRAEGEPYLLLREQFTRDSLAAFDVVDDAAATIGAPSDWVQEDGHVEQRSPIEGPLAAGVARPGTYLVRTADGQLSVDDLIVTAAVTPAGTGAVGLVFRYQDADNFYFFVMDAGHGFRRIGRKVGGVFADLSTPAQDLSTGYAVGDTSLLKVRAEGSSLQAWVDGRLVVSGHDESIPTAGRVGFLSAGDAAATFDDLHVITL